MREIGAVLVPVPPLAPGGACVFHLRGDGGVHPVRDGLRLTDGDEGGAVLLLGLGDHDGLRAEKARGVRTE